MKGSQYFLPLLIACAGSWTGCGGHIVESAGSELNGHDGSAPGDEPLDGEDDSGSSASDRDAAQSVDDSDAAGGGGTTGGGASDAGRRDGSTSTDGSTRDSGGGGTTGGANDGGSTGGGKPVVPPVSTPVEAPLSGTNNVFENVTPSSLRNGSIAAMDVLADPAKPGSFYAFIANSSNQGSIGVFKSMDWGATWARVSTDGRLEHGLPWGEAMAPDGSYMLACNGYPDNGNQGAWKSIDGGKTWKPYTMSQDNDPYSFDIDPTDAKHVLGSTHAKPNIYESFDGGETWRDRGSAGTGGSNYVFFINSTTWLSIPQDGGDGQTRRTTNSGASWSNVCPAQHAHGNAQIYIDPDNGHIFMGGHNAGVYRSTDGGASCTQVSNTRASSVWGTGKYIYAMDPGANFGGTPPMPQRALRSDPTKWMTMQHPPEMNNGMKRAAVAYDKDSNRWVIVGGNWVGGLWRYIEGPN